MRARLVILAAVVVVAAVQFSREPGRAVAPVPREPAPTVSATAAPHLAPAPPASTLTRDPFRFADQEPVGRASRAPSGSLAAPPSPEPAAARVRLVGLVRRAGVLRAALIVDGEVVLASAGDTVGGFRVVSLDEEVGVAIRDPEGLEVTLALPEGP